MRQGLACLLALCALCALASAADRPALEARGWTETARNEWRWDGTAPDGARLQYLAPVDSREPPQQLLDRMVRALAEQSAGQLRDCRDRAAPGDGSAVKFCTQGMPSGAELLAAYFVRRLGGRLQAGVVLASATPGARQRVEADLPLILALGLPPAPAAEAPAVASGHKRGRIQDSAAYRAAGGEGADPDEIVGVFHHWNWMYVYPSGMSDVGKDYLLFENGEVWRAPDLAPQRLDVAAARRARPQDWGRWSRKGGRYTLRLPGDEPFEPGVFTRYEPAPRAQRVEGAWNAFHGAVAQAGMDSSTSVVSSRTLRLHKDGRFDRGGFSGGSFSHAIGGTTSAGTMGRAHAARAGHYEIDGYSLRLRYDDGSVEHKLFYWAGGEDEPLDMMMLDGVGYLRADD